MAKRKDIFEEMEENSKHFAKMQKKYKNHKFKQEEIAFASAD